MNEEDTNRISRKCGKNLFVSKSHPGPLFTIEEMIDKANTMFYLQGIGYTVIEDGTGFIARKERAMGGE